MARVMQLAPEVSEGLGLGGLGPEQARDELPGLRAARMGGQVRDEGYGAGRPGRRAGAVVGDDLLPQEGHVQHFDTASWPQGKRNVMPGASPEGNHGSSAWAASWPTMRSRCCPAGRATTTASRSNPL